MKGKQHECEKRVTSFSNIGFSNINCEHLPSYLYISFNSLTICLNTSSIFRDFVFIDDVLHAWKLIIKDKKYFNNVYNIGSGKKTLIKDLIKEISSVLDKKIIIKVEKGTPGDFLGCYANIGKIKNHLGYSPKYNLKQGLKLFNKWLNKNEKY
jgi:nucleoside-diphosphate-sugar epimerase